MKTLAFALASCGCAVAGYAARPAVPATQPQALQKVIGCRTMTDDHTRLSCYDAAVRGLDNAVSAAEVVVLDRDQLRTAKRHAFGLAGEDALQVPGAAGIGAVNVLTAKARSVSANASGQLIVVLEDGARWEQTDDTFVPSRFGASPTVVIKRAALGSYKMSVDGRVEVRARRTG